MYIVLFIIIVTFPHPDCIGSMEIKMMMMMMMMSPKKKGKGIPVTCSGGP
jgi:hypothetical protein